jgi:hypothetical protein
LFISGWLEKSTSARDKFAPKINLAVSSTEFCQCKFDKGKIGIRLSGGGGHGGMIPPHQIIFPRIAL